MKRLSLLTAMMIACFNMRSIAADPPAAPATQPNNMAMQDEMAKKDGPATQAAATTRPTANNLGAIAGPEVGSAAPDIKLLQSNGTAMQLSSHKGQIVVLEFGSWSCPTFRDKAAAMEKLKAEIGPDVTMVLIYTREAHAVDEKEIQRNVTDKINLTQPTTFEARKEIANRAVAALHITLPMVVDSIDDQAVKAFGGFPNGVVVIGKDGTIAARQRWVDPDVLKREIDEAKK